MMVWILLAMLAAEGPWLEIPFVPQSGSRCGAASIAMVMQYWNAHQPGNDSRAADERSIYQALPAVRGKGISGEALRRYLELHNFDAFVFNGELDDLRGHLSKGRPVVVCLAPREKRGPLHFAVAAGIAGGEIWLNDPARGKLFRQSIDQFEREWSATGRWALLATPRGVKVESTGEELSTAALDRGLKLARAGDFQKAREAFVEGARENPQDARFAMELAGVAYQLHDFESAKQRLREALRVDRSSVYGNDFLATLYLMEGNLDAALKYWNRIGKPVIGSVRFDPELPVNPLLRDRTLVISAGQILTRDRLQTTRANVDRLGFVTRFEVSPREGDRYDLTLRSSNFEQPMTGWIGTLVRFGHGLPYQTLDLDFKNLGRRAIHASFLGRWDANKRRLAASVAGPVRMNPRLGYRVAVDARDERWDLPGLHDLGLRKIEAGGELIYGITGTLQWTSGLWASAREFRNVEQSALFTNRWTGEFRNRLSSLLWSSPEHRVRVDAFGELRNVRPAPFTVVQSGVSATWLDAAVRARTGKIFGSATFDELFMLGMERDNDLWMRGHVGTRDGRKGSAPLGSSYTLIQTEFDKTVLKPALVRVQLGPFLDVGRVTGSHGWMTDTGVQAKIKTIGPVTWTVVYGRNLRDGGGVFYTAVSR